MNSRNKIWKVDENKVSEIMQIMEFHQWHFLKIFYKRQLMQRRKLQTNMQRSWGFENLKANKGNEPTSMWNSYPTCICSTLSIRRIRKSPTDLFWAFFPISVGVGVGDSFSASHMTGNLWSTIFRGALCSGYPLVMTNNYIENYPF